MNVPESEGGDPGVRTEPFRIAAAQTRITHDPAANGAEIRALMTQAAESGARLVLFPEGAMTGYTGPRAAGGAGGDWTHADWQQIREQLQATADHAGRLGLWTVVGGNHRLGGAHRPHNSLYAISDTGTLVGRYDKRFCSHNETQNWYTPGFEPLTFHTGGFAFGCALCVEIQFPEVFMDYVALGVECVLFSSYSDDPAFDTLARAHAALNCVWMAVSVPAQCSTAMPAGIIAPNGTWLARAPAEGTTAVVCADLDRTDPDLDVALNKARPWRAAAREGEIYRSRRFDTARSADRLTY